ncbi:MAG: N-6 DNA methylase [Promethearchaeota archaeon]
MEKTTHKEKSKRRALGVHLTSQDTFLTYIFPEIKDILYEHIWIDLYCGEGNLIYPILENIPKSERVDFFQNHIYLSDIQPQMIQKCIEKAQSYDIPIHIAKKKKFLRDNLETFPIELKKKRQSIYYITNPPYLYLGYIRKHEETKKHLKYFTNENDGYQDLYQIAMISDLRNNIDNLIYIIPSNFLFGAAVSNKFRLDFLKYYKIIKMKIFEIQIFEFTGTNICIGFFKRKERPKTESQKFNGIKFKKNDVVLKRVYDLFPSSKYRGGAEFNEFVKKYKAIKPLEVKYYLLNDQVDNNKGDNEIKVIDTNEYVSNDYERKVLRKNDSLKKKVISNILYVRTVDTGSMEGRASYNLIKEDFNVDGIFVSKATYRTSPIQVFLKPIISIKDQLLLKDFFNLMLEHFRESLDSEFLTTYKYSNAEYTRKYLGLTRVRKLIETYPIRNLNNEDKIKLRELIERKKIGKLIRVLGNLKKSERKENPSTLKRCF